MKTDVYKGYEHVVGRSETVPNQALSLRDIIMRSSRGQYLAEVAGNQLQYGEDEDPDNDTLDGIEDKFDALDRASYLEARLAELRAAQVRKEAEKKTIVPQAEQSEAQQTDVSQSAKE